MKTRSLHRQNVIGATWMVTAMAAIAVEDARVKAVSDLPLVRQIMMIFGLGGALIFTAIARRQGDAPRLFRQPCGAACFSSSRGSSSMCWLWR